MIVFMGGGVLGWRFLEGWVDNELVHWVGGLYTMEMTIITSVLGDINICAPLQAPTSELASIDEVCIWVALSKVWNEFLRLLLKLSSVFCVLVSVISPVPSCSYLSLI
jgi:hypothetical protein